MVSRHRAAAALAATFVLVAAVAAAQAAPIRFVTAPEPAGAQVDAVRAACAQMADELSTRGWTVPYLSVRVAANPYDATAAGTDLSLPTSIQPADAAYLLAVEVVTRNLSGRVDDTDVRLLARTVAAHLSGSDSRQGAAWQEAWQARLRRGDVVSTALVEAVWREAGDAGIRALAGGDLRDRAVQTLTDSGVADPVAVTAEIALAGLLQPSALGFSAIQGVEALTGPPVSDDPVVLSRPALQMLELPPDGDAAGVLLVRGRDVSTWVAVRYRTTDGFDAVPLEEGEELPVPLTGVASAAVVVVGLDGDASASLAVRRLVDFPVHLDHWEYRASEGTVELGWETASHVGLSAYVVEALQRQDDAWAVARRSIVPVSDQGAGSYRYSFVDDDTRGIDAYRVLALTTKGLLAEIGTFPLTEPVTHGAHPAT